MKKKTTIILIIFLVLMVSCTQRDTNPPDILLIMADDMGYSILDVMGLKYKHLTLISWLLVDCDLPGFIILPGAALHGLHYLQACIRIRQGWEE